MIDTDKYEGHSMGWSLDDPDDWAWAMNMFTAAGKTNEADAQLIADAPLLLAEVKRLREVMIHVEQRQPHPALEMALKQGLYLSEIRERIE
jgi:hypothetical protein